jgi:hypothetical protein
MIDPVVAEVRAARERIADASGGDMHAIATATRQRQIESGVDTVTRPSRQPIIATGSRNNAMHPSRGSAVS